MLNVYPWPPVLATSRSWNLKQPVARSYSMVNGRRVASTAKRPRRIAKLTVHPRRNYGFGYMVALERLLEGGVNLVRLKSCRMGWGVINTPRLLMETAQVDWLSTDDQADWYSGGDLILWGDEENSGVPFSISEEGYVLTVQGTGAEAGTVILAPGDFLTVFQGSQQITVMATAPSVVQEDGSASVRLLQPLASGSGTVLFGTFESGLFEMIGDFPELTKEGSGPQRVELNFRQVFEDELRSELREVNPWT